MQSWQIKALELEASALDRLDGFIRDHALVFFIAAIYLLLALLVWVLVGGLRRKPGNPRPYVLPVIVIRVDSPPPPPLEPPFDPFPAYREPLCYDHAADDWE